MERLRVHSGARLTGTLPAAGAKNAALPILIATLLAPGVHKLERVPALMDVNTTLQLLERLGSVTTRATTAEGLSVSIDATRLPSPEAPEDLVRKMRASVLALGPLLARCGEAVVPLPGGCAIGARPIDQHLKGLIALGCRFDIRDGAVYGRVDRLKGAVMHLDMPTVTGTENILMAAVLAEGTTEIHNAACEPEIEDLAGMLRAMGAKIEGDGTSVLRVEGVTSLRPAARPWRILPDRIEAGTYLVGAAITGGDVTIEGIRAPALESVLQKLEAAGCTIDRLPSAIRCRGPRALAPLHIETEPFPGFPTDMQAQFMAMLSVAHGSSTIKETIFENRFMHAAQLQKMGARIDTAGSLAVIHGVERLRAARVKATDLRASAALVLAGLVSDGVTEIEELHHIDRGYERLEERFRTLGATLERVRAAEWAAPQVIAG